MCYLLILLVFTANESSNEPSARLINRPELQCWRRAWNVTSPDPNYHGTALALGIACLAFLCVCADIIVTIRQIPWNGQIPSPCQPQGCACHWMHPGPRAETPSLLLPAYLIGFYKCLALHLFFITIEARWNCFCIGKWNFRLSKSLSWGHGHSYLAPG